MIASAPLVRLSLRAVFVTCVLLLSSGCSSSEQAQSGLAESAEGAAADVSGGGDSAAGASTEGTPTEGGIADIGPFETVLISSPESIATGEQRLVMQLRRGVQRHGDETMTATVEFDTLGVDAYSLPATWVFGDEATGAGAWIVRPDLGTKGTWLATLTVGDITGTAVNFKAQSNTPMPRRGEAAPIIETATLETESIETITTDPEPDERMYRQSLDQSIADGRPVVIVFSTPAYCTTTVCGPVLDLVKSRIDTNDDVDFVHVEVYEPLPEDSLDLIPRAPVLDWGIQTEPWIFTIDSAGDVVRSFEGVLGPAELDEALAEL